MGGYTWRSICCGVGRRSAGAIAVPVCADAAYAYCTHIEAERSIGQGEEARFEEVELDLHREKNDVDD